MSRNTHIRVKASIVSRAPVAPVLLLLLLCTSCTLMRIAGNCSDYQGGWWKVTVGDQTERSGHKYLSWNMSEHPGLRHFVEVNGLPDYLFVSDVNNIQLLYEKSGQVFLWNTDYTKDVLVSTRSEDSLSDNDKVLIRALRNQVERSAAAVQTAVPDKGVLKTKQSKPLARGETRKEEAGAEKFSGPEWAKVLHAKNTSAKDVPVPVRSSSVDKAPPEAGSDTQIEHVEPIAQSVPASTPRETEVMPAVATEPEVERKTEPPPVVTVPEQKRPTVPPKVDRERMVSQGLGKVARPGSFGPEPKAVVDGVEQWINAGEFEVYDALRVCMRDHPFGSLPIVRDRSQGILRDLGQDGTVTKAMQGGLDTLDARIKVIEQQMDTKDTAMKKAYMETLESAAGLKKRADRTASRLTIFAGRLQKIDTSVQNWVDYYQRTSPLIGATAADEGITKMIRPVYEDWIVNSLQGR